MIPPRFEYHAPKTVGEAVALLGQLGSDAKLLAGGHSLLPMMKSPAARFSLRVFRTIFRQAPTSRARCQMRWVTRPRDQQKLRVRPKNA